MDPKDLPGYIDYEDDITHKDLDNLRDTVERIKKNKIEMEKELKLQREIKAKGQKEFEKKIERGKLTYDHKGKVISIRQVKAEKLPVDFKQLMAYSMNNPKKVNKKNRKNLKIKRKANATFREPSEESKGRFWNKFSLDKSLIQTYKNTKLVKAHLKSTKDHGINKDNLAVSPSDGVAFIPDPETKEKIQGRPYKYKLRQFQSEFMENRGRRNKSLLDETTFEEVENAEEEAIQIRNKNLSLDFGIYLANL